MDTGVIIALIGAFVTITGWLVTNYLARRGEDRTKRLQMKLDYTRLQIEEFYGPLYSLINQVFTYDEVKERLVSDVIDCDRRKIETYFRENYFSNLHVEIRNLLKNKFHLLEGAELPGSHWNYLQHSLQEKAQNDLYGSLGISTSHIDGFPWPENFSKEVGKQLHLLMKRYDTLLRKL